LLLFFQKKETIASPFSSKVNRIRPRQLAGAPGALRISRATACSPNSVVEDMPATGAITFMCSREHGAQGRGSDDDDGADVPGRQELRQIGSDKFIGAGFDHRIGRQRRQHREVAFTKVRQELEAEEALREAYRIRILAD
jgi:hypothetical protein